MMFAPISYSNALFSILKFVLDQYIENVEYDLRHTRKLAYVQSLACLHGMSSCIMPCEDALPERTVQYHIA